MWCMIPSLNVWKNNEDSWKYFSPFSYVCALEKLHWSTCEVATSDSTAIQCFAEPLQDCSLIHVHTSLSPLTTKMSSGSNTPQIMMRKLIMNLKWPSERAHHTFIRECKETKTGTYYKKIIIELYINRLTVIISDSRCPSSEQKLNNRNWQDSEHKN
jgi:hypothetical protein